MVTTGVVSVTGGVVTEGVTSGVVCDVTEGVGVVTIKMYSYVIYYQIMGKFNFVIN